MSRGIFCTLGFMRNLVVKFGINDIFTVKSGQLALEDKGGKSDSRKDGFRIV